MAERAPQSSQTDNDAACSNHEGNETNRSVRPGTLYLSPGISTERHFLVTNCCLLLLSPAAETLESYLQLLVPRRHHGGAEEEGGGEGGCTTCRAALWASSVVRRSGCAFRSGVG